MGSAADVKANGRSKAANGDASQGVPLIRLNETLPYLFHLISSRLNLRFGERLRPHGVTVHRWRVLVVVFNLGPRRIGELAELTLFPQSALSRIVDQMERDKLVVRQTSQDDSRVIEVHLTAHGRALYGELFPTALAHAEAMTSNLSAAERKTLLRLLRSILTLLQTKGFPDSADMVLLEAKPKKTRQDGSRKVKKTASPD